jgi:hypothetical protein
MSVRPPSQYPCAPDAHASIRLAAVRGDAHLIRRILAESDEQLDVSKLTAVLHLLVRLGLVQDLLRAGMRAETLSTTLQELWLGEAVTAGLADDTAALLRAGFVPSHETLQNIRLKAIRSDAWKDISATFGAADARRKQLAWL